MNIPALLEKAHPYLNSEWHESRTPWEQRKQPPFVTVSREAGSGGASFARILARKLNAESAVTWRVFEGNLATHMLQENRLPARFAKFLPERRLSELNSSIGELVGLHPNLWNLVEKMNQTIRQLARAGHVILVGRGANFATAGIENGTHIRLVAPVAQRARYLAKLYNISEQSALAHNAKCDSARRSYVRATFSADIANPTAYDLVINTGQNSLIDAANLAYAHLQRERIAAPA